MFLRGELPDHALSRGRARPGHRHALRHRRADVPGPAAHRLRQPLRRLTSASTRPRFRLRPISRRTHGGVRVGAIGDVGTPCAGPDGTQSASRSASVPRCPTLLVIVGGGNMGAALLGGLLAGGGADAGDARGRRGAARRGATSSPTLFPGVAVTADVPPCAAAVIAVKPRDVAGAVARRGRRRCPPRAVDRRRRADRRARGGGRATASPSCGRCRTRRPSSGRARRRSPAAPPRPTTTSPGPSAILGAVGTVARVAEQHLDAVTGAHRLRPGVPVPRRRGADRRRRRGGPAAAAGDRR